MPGEKFSSQKEGNHTGNKLGDTAGNEDKRTRNLRTPQMGTMGPRIYVKAYRGPDPQSGGGHDATKL